MTTFAHLVQPHVQTERAAAASAQARGQFYTAFRRIATSIGFAVLAALATLCLEGCMSPPKDLDMALDKPSGAGVHRVALLPPAEAPAINQMHSWNMKLATPDGTYKLDGMKFSMTGW